MTSEHYRQQIIDLTEWFTVRITRLPFHRPTEQQRIRGIDSMPQRFLADLAREIWWAERYYELTDAQLSVAMLLALNDAEYAVHAG
jgi:hypothetical protein